MESVFTFRIKNRSDRQRILLKASDKMASASIRDEVHSRAFSYSRGEFRNDMRTRVKILTEKPDRVAVVCARNLHLKDMRLVVTFDGVKHAVPVLIEFGFVHNYIKVIFDNKRVVKPMLDYMSPDAQMIENLAALLIAQVQTCGVGKLDCIQIDSRYLTGGVG